MQSFYIKKHFNNRIYNLYAVLSGVWRCGRSIWCGWGGGGSHFLQKQTLPECFHSECNHLHYDDLAFLKRRLMFLLLICFVVLLLVWIGLDCVETFNYLLARVGPPALQITNRKQISSLSAKIPGCTTLLIN